MSDTHDAGDVPDYSVWGDKFNMEAFRTNPARWNKDWEKALRTRPASEVFTHMTKMFMKSMNNKEVIPMLRGQMIRMQEAVVKLWDSVEKLGGFEDSYSRVAGRQDARCWAPEITVSGLLKRSGQNFLELIQEFVKGKKEAGVGKPYFYPSPWWDKVLEGVPQSVPDGLDQRTVELSTIQRNDFITKYLLYVAMSVFHDISMGSAGMKPVTDLMTNDPHTTESFAKVAQNRREQPVVRCQSCTDTQVENGPKFMVCSTCKSKLNFTIHYCSAKCQAKDWPNHKKHCGKEKIAKKLPGTIHDPFWFQPDMPDGLRNIPINDRGTVGMDSLGFIDPKNAPRYSSALQRQVNLITADRDVDYFLFDNMDRPVRFVLEDPMLKMSFRIMRTEALSSENPKTVEGMAEHVIKVMGQKPGLSTAGIISQFNKEYGRDMTDKISRLESNRSENLTMPESTFLNVSQSITGDCRKLT
ncbi:hypothetical protein BDZ94DRAFT_1312645 [Collybia nuda]|uniref:MYND-type domain-containing protein n=1 Tax=Collybia nuda TaxID=64659 RepID=A0A9P6CB85_9AGAR|nr:hypothetical protein BDZ94DRAFT_1312645 [Collybia nuda]